MSKILSLSFFAGFMLYHLTAIAEGQDRIRTIDDSPKIENSPIIVVSRELGSKTFDTKNRLLGDRDWLKQLTLGIKNISNKNITYFHINLIIPKQGKMPGSFGLHIFYVTRSERERIGVRDLKSGEKILRPDEIVKVKVSNDEISSWDKDLKKYDAEDYDRVTIDIREVHFDDGTGWQLGIPLQQKPSDPTIWEAVPQGKTSKTVLSPNWVAMLPPIRGMDIFQDVAFSIPAIGRNFFVPSSLPPGPACGYWRGNSVWSSCCKHPLKCYH